MILPQEILDKIFLYSDYNTLKNCRELQSDHIKKCTEYFDLIQCIEQNGDILNFKWIYSDKDNHNPNISYINYAVSCQRHDIVKWLRSIGVTWDTCTLAYAVEEIPDLKYMKWLYSEGAPLSSSCVFSTAVRHSDIEILEWLKKEGAPYDPHNVHYFILQKTADWMILNGYDISQYDID